MARKSYNNDGRTAEDRALDVFAELMIEHLKSVQQDWHKPWFSPNAMIPPKNMNGRQYNGGNRLMLMMLGQKEGYTVPVYATFNAIYSLNFTKQLDGTRKPVLDANGDQRPQVTVNKGAHAFPVQLISYTVVHKETHEKIPIEEYRRLDEEGKKAYNVYPKNNIHLVFNVCAQTNLQESRPELYDKLVSENTPQRSVVTEGERYTFAPLDAMIEHGGWVCPIKESDGDSCFYSIANDSITMVQRDKFESGEAFATTAFHEMCHSLGPEGRLGRFKEGCAFGSKPYSVEECTAEMTAALVASQYGLEKIVKEESVPYIKGWLDNLQESPEFIKTLLSDVKRASNVMTQRFDAIQERIDQGFDNPIPDHPIFSQKKVAAREANDGEHETIAARRMPTAEPEKEQEAKSGGWRR